MLECVCLYVEPISRSKDYVRSWIKTDSVVCLSTPVSPSVLGTEDVYAPGGVLLWWCTFAGVYIPCVYTRMPGGVTVCGSGLCCCVPCLSSAIISLCLLILHDRSRPHSVSDYISKSNCLWITHKDWFLSLSFYWIMISCAIAKLATVKHQTGNSTGECNRNWKKYILLSFQSYTRMPVCTQCYCKHNYCLQ